MAQPDEAHKLTDQELAKLERRIAKVYKDATAEMQESVTAYFESFAKRDEEMKKLIGTVQNGKEWTEEDYRQWRLAQIGRGQWFEVMRDNLAERMTKANEIAIAYVNNDMAKIYALNRTYTIQKIIGEADGALDHIDWVIYDEYAVKRLLVEQPDLLPCYPAEKAVKRGIDLEYGKKKITAAVTSGIIQGKSVGAVAKNLMDSIPNMSRVSAILAARTATTEAENAGRQAAAEDLEKMGVILKKTWSCVHDEHTRSAHYSADRQSVGIHDPFIVGGEKMMFPGDGSMGASGWNRYNCRCVRQDEIAGFKSILPKSKRGQIKVRVAE